MFPIRTLLIFSSSAVLPSEPPICITHFEPRGLWVGLACPHVAASSYSGYACQDTLSHCLINRHGQKHSCIAELKPSLHASPLYIQKEGVQDNDGSKGCELC